MIDNMDDYKEENGLHRILDAITEDITKDFPKLTEDQVAFSTIRLNLTTMIHALTELGLTGQGLSIEGLLYVTSSLMATVQWMAAKELLNVTVAEIEEELKG